MKNQEIKDLKFIKSNIGNLVYDNACMHVHVPCSIPAHEYSDIPVYIFEEVSSTNAIAKELAENCENCAAPHGTVAIANSQTSGRGRLGRSFESPDGSGLYMSIVLRPCNKQRECDNSVSNIFDPALVTVAAGVAVAHSLKNVCCLDANIKWVNDILIDEKKLCGILAEGVIDAYSGRLNAIVLGIGINLRVPETGYPNDVSSIITTVEDAINKRSNTNNRSMSAVRFTHDDTVHLRNLLAADITVKLLDLLKYDEHTSNPINENSDKYSYNRSRLIEEYKALCSTIGKNILVYKHGLSGDSLPARAVDIDENGGLIVEYDTNTSKIETLTFGEISIRPQKA